jgi:hypothetical protein
MNRPSPGEIDPMVARMQSGQNITEPEADLSTTRGYVELLEEIRAEIHRGRVRMREVAAAWSGFDATELPISSALGECPALTAGSDSDPKLALLDDIKEFMLAAGGGRLAFVGRQYPLTVAGDEFHVDLLFFHVALLRYVVVELKVGKFAPEFTGKLNFYVSAVDGEVSTEKHGPTIGILLCAALNSQVVEYSLNRLGSPIGVTTYEVDEGNLRKELPDDLRDELPAPDQLQARLRRLVSERRETVEALLEASEE